MAPVRVTGVNGLGMAVRSCPSFLHRIQEERYRRPTRVIVIVITGHAWRPQPAVTAHRARGYCHAEVTFFFAIRLHHVISAFFHTTPMVIIAFESATPRTRRLTEADRIIRHVVSHNACFRLSAAFTPVFPSSVITTVVLLLHCIMPFHFTLFFQYAIFAHHVTACSSPQRLRRLRRHHRRHVN